VLGIDLHPTTATALRDAIVLLSGHGAIATTVGIRRTGDQKSRRLSLLIF